MNNSIDKNELQVKFKPKKVSVMKASKGMLANGEYSRAMRMEHCGSHLFFMECPEGHGRKLFSANFCRDRLCPLCSWRRSRLLFKQILEMLHVASSGLDLRYLFLTLTVENCKGDDLADTLDQMFLGFNQLFKYKEVDKQIVGWIRNLELTYNDDKKTFHPHFHVLIAVKPDYFRGSNYINQAKWTKLWQKAARLGYKPMVNIKAVKARRVGQSVEGAVAETAKYSVKDADYIKQDERLTAEIMSYLITGLKGRRLIGFGKLFSRLRRVLKQKDVESEAADLVGYEHDGRTCPICNSDLKETLYKWNYATSNYVKSEGGFDLESQ